MRRLMLTTSFAVLAALPVAAQSRIPGVPVPGSFFSRSTFGMPSPRILLFARRPANVPRRIIVPVAVPLYFNPYYPVMASNYAEATPTVAARQPDPEIESLREEVHSLREEMLTDEIDRLREEREVRRDARERRQDRATRDDEEEAPPPAKSRPQAAPRSSGREEIPAIVLVFRDGHRLEVRDYAVVGQTLWNFAEGGTRRVLLSSLDLDRTAAVNEERGVEFRLPSKQD